MFVFAAQGINQGLCLGGGHVAGFVGFRCGPRSGLGVGLLVLLRLLLEGAGAVGGSG